MEAVEAHWVREDHRLLRESARRFFRTELTPCIESWRERGVVPREFWVKAGHAGLLGTGAPEQFGGPGGDYGHEAIVALELARTGDTGWGWPVHTICLHYIVNCASDDQRARWLPALISGERVAAIAMTEPGTGSDLQAIKTKAELHGDRYRLSGAKTFISNGQTADFVIVAAKTDSAQGAKGISLFVVETETAMGFRRGRNLEKLGMKGQDTSELFFENVEVPAENLLGGTPGQGFYQLMQQLPWERLLIAISALGMSEEMVRVTTEYVQQRTAFGKRLAEFQNTRFKLAECATKVTLLRTFVEQCVGRMMTGQLDGASASMAKWWGAQAQCEIADECLQLHGGYGYMMEYPIARYYADARVQQIYGGTREVMKELIARSILGP